MLNADGAWGWIDIQKERSLSLCGIWVSGRFRLAVPDLGRPVIEVLIGLVYRFLSGF